MKRKTLILLFLIYSCLIYAVPGNNYDLMIENQHAAIYYDESRQDVAVENLHSGYLWRSILSEEALKEKALGEQWTARVQSLCEFNYSIPHDENIYFGSEESEERTITSELIHDTLVLHLDFTKLDIRFDMEFSLTDTGVRVSIPYTALEEYGENQIVSLSPVPFFGAADDLVEGYAFYPDGAGALHYFTEEHPEYITDYRAMVYNRPVLDMDTDIFEGEPVLIPVYGMKQDDEAFVAYAVSGDSDMKISFSPSGYRIDYNRIGAEFIYRHTYKIKRSNVVSKSTQSLNTVVEILDNQIIDGDRMLNIDLLTGDTATYSGMANAYRAHLISQDELVDHIDEDDTIAILIKNLLGITEERILTDRFIPMTTFEQLSQMTEELESSGVEKLVYQLIGWEKRGYRAYPSRPPVARKLGGTKGLEEFLEGLERSAHKVFLLWNEVDAKRENHGFSAYNDVLKNPLGLVITDAFNAEYIISPLVAEKRLDDDIIAYFDEMPISGIMFTGAGELLLMDAHDGERQLRSDSREIILQMLASVTDAFGDVGALSGNKYVLSKATELSDVPLDDSGYYFTDETVPFYQMLIHGYIPYSGSPGNLHWDMDELKLQWIEYGYEPMFELSWLDALELEDTDYAWLFNSSFEKWKQTIIEISKEFNQNLSDINHLAMIEHRILEEDLVAVTYENGTTVVINYQDKPAVYRGNLIEPLDYLVLPEEAQS